MKLIIIAGIIFGPLIILGISKIISKMSGTVKKANPFKYAFWPLIFLGSVFSKPKKLIMWMLIVGAGYGIYLLVNYFTPPKSERLFKQIIANQIEVQTKGETVNLEEMAKSSGTSALSSNELKLAQKNRIDADKKRKNLESMLKKPEEKPASAQTQKTEWIMSLLATDKQMERENKQKPYSELTVCELFSSDSEIRVTYINAVGKKETTKLTRWRKDSFYGGWYVNTHPKKRRDNVEFSLLQDEEAPFYLESVSGKKVKISSQFKGYLGKNEIEVKIFKRVSSS